MPWLFILRGHLMPMTGTRQDLFIKTLFITSRNQNQHLWSERLCVYVACRDDRFYQVAWAFVVRLRAPLLPSTAELKLHWWSILLSCHGSQLELLFENRWDNEPGSLSFVPSRSRYSRKGALELADTTVCKELNYSSPPMPQASIAWLSLVLQSFLP